MSTAVARGRTTEFIRLALLLSVTPSQLNGHPRLHGLVADSIAHGVRLVASFPDRPLDEDENLWTIEDSLPVSRPPGPIEGTLNLGGLAVPALLEKLHDVEPAERASACVLLDRLNAIVEIGRIDSMTTDKGRFLWGHGDYYDNATVAEAAAGAASHLRSMISSVRYEMAIFALATSWDGSGLINGIRQSSKSMEAKSWDDWWTAARPAWRIWWRLAGDNCCPSSYKDWNNALRAIESIPEPKK